MDSDSFVINIRNDLVKQLIKLQEEKELLDFNEIAEDHPLYPNDKTDIIGKFKIEIPDTIYVDKLCALRSKAYAYNIFSAKKKRTSGYN